MLPAFLWWIVILAVAVTIGLIAFLVWRRRRKKPEADVKPKEQIARSGETRPRTSPDGMIPSVSMRPRCISWCLGEQRPEPRPSSIGPP